MYSKLSATKQQEIVAKTKEFVSNAEVNAARNFGKLSKIDGFKFMKDVLLVYMFQQEIHATLKKFQQMYPHHIITPIPMHEENKKSRTFAHIDEMLLAANMSFSHTMKKITTDTQSKKTRMQRLETKKLFETISDVKCKNFIIFDDIKTTGVTMKLAKKALLEAGATSVKLLAFSGGISKISTDVDS